MKPGIPWSVKGIEPEVREAAKHAARKAGMTLGEWLNSVILDQSDEPEGGEPAESAPAPQEYLETHAPPPAMRRDDTTVRLEDIAQQLSRLAQREREGAAILPYEPPRPHRQESETLNRILSRIDNNERQTVEAFSAVNERLSVLGRQISQSVQPSRHKPIEKPEDVPGFASLESAIRNVVEHIEVSDKRTRDSLKSMQDRLAEMSQRTTRSDAEDLVRAAPAFAGLEQRVADLALRFHRSETEHQASLQDIVRKEINQLADRIETVRRTAEQQGTEAHSAAVAAAQRDLRDIESRILGLLKETETTLASQSAAGAADLQRIRGEIAAANKRIDEVRQSSADGRDVHALRIAVEQLSARVAQGPDMRPLADMDNRIGEIARRLDQNQAALRNLPQFAELERRIGELDHRLAEAMQAQGDDSAMRALEQQITAVNDRVARTEEQLGHLETMEHAIRQLYDGLEEGRGMIAQAAEDAATRAAERVMAGYQAAAAQPSPELRALEEGLRAVRDSAALTDKRNQETLEAVHETLEQIVNKLAELETSSAGIQLAANMVQQAKDVQPPQAASVAPAPVATETLQTSATPGLIGDTAELGGLKSAIQSGFDTLVPAPEMPVPPPAPGVAATEPASAIEMMPEPAPAGSASDEPADDFIAAARRAAQTAASRSAAPAPDAPPAAKPGGNGRFKLSLPFLRRSRKLKPVTYVGGKPVSQTRAEVRPKTANDNKRRKLILAALVLLAAASAFTFNMMSRPSKPAKQSMQIEVPASSAKSAGDLEDIHGSPVAVTAAPAANMAALQEGPANDLTTGSLPAQKTDASLASIVAEPGTAAESAGLPDPQVGSLALRQAAAAGDAKAQFIVASRYLDGEGVEQNLPKAAKWYQLAASHGLAPAQYRLASLFERGKGVPQDMAAAQLWYERAAGQGNVKAMHNAAVIAAGNLVGTPNYDRAFALFTAAAEHGLKDSQYNLAVLYERGLGSKIDKSEAFFWYSVAGKQGDQDAAKRAAQLAASLESTEAAKLSARVAAWTPRTASDEANVVAVTDAAWNAPGGAEAGLVPPAASGESPEQAALDPVTETQRLLVRLGFNIGTPDGNMGGRTQNAIRLFQLQSNMKVTGEITPELLEALRARNRLPGSG